MLENSFQSSAPNTERATEGTQLVDDIIPGCFSSGCIPCPAKLVGEGVSIRDHQTILESLAEVGNRIKDPEALTEMVRQGLVPTSLADMDEDGVIHFITFAQVEEH